MIETLKKSIETFENNVPIQLIKMAYDKLGEKSTITHVYFEDSVTSIEDDKIFVKFIDIEIDSHFENVNNCEFFECMIIRIIGNDVDLIH